MSAPVRVALDVHALQVEGYADRGIGRYVAGYARALHRRGAVAAALLAPELPPASGLPGELVESGSLRWDSQESCRSLLSSAAAGTGLAYHVTAPFLHCGPGDPPSLGVVEHWARSGLPRVVLLHDLIPLRAPHHYLPSRVAQERYRARADWVADSDLIVTNSEHTRGEALDLLGADPARVVTVGAGVSRYFSPPDGTDEELFRFHFDRRLGGRPFVLTVGGSDVRKGTDRAIAAFAGATRAGLDLCLVVAGHLTSTFRAGMEETARACGVAERVVLAGAVDDELLRACYRRAVVSMMPSLAEGAGLPVLESAACGTPALASSTTALAETAATPEAWFDPADTDSIAEVLAATVRDAGRRSRILAAQRAVAAASSWEAVAGRAGAALDRLGSGPRRAVPVPGDAGPLRVALVGPGPEVGPVAAAMAAVPVGSACADGAPGGRVEVTPVGAGPAGVTLAAFGPDVRPASFDHVVYFLRSDPAGDGSGLERRYPGWLWADSRYVAERGAQLAALAGSCRGLIVEAADRTRVELLLGRLGSRPPVVVLPPGGGAPDRAGAVLTALCASGGPD